MAAPYYYYYSSPYLHSYYNPVHVSPFIPPAVLSSPGTPVRHAHFDDEPVLPPRERRPSWHAGMAGMAPAPNGVPFPSPPYPYAGLPPMIPLAPPVSYDHRRRRSDGNLPQPAWVAVPTYPPYYSPYGFQQPLPSPQLHPLLNGESSDGPLLLLDLSLNTLKPMRLNKPGKSTGVALSMDELAQPATYPPIKRMKITYDKIPQWPIVLKSGEQKQSGYLAIPSSSHEAPITLGDVLIAIHRHLQFQITQVDWARLSLADTTAIARAYTRRCRTFPSAEAFEKSQGVRRVDYLLDKFMFKGLVRSGAGQEGFENVKLRVGAK